MEMMNYVEIRNCFFLWSCMKQKCMRNNKYVEQILQNRKKMWIFGCEGNTFVIWIIVYIVISFFQDFNVINIQTIKLSHLATLFQFDLSYYTLWRWLEGKLSFSNYQCQNSLNCYFSPIRVKLCNISDYRTLSCMRAVIILSKECNLIVKVEHLELLLKVSCSETIQVFVSCIYPWNSLK